MAAPASKKPNSEDASRRLLRRQQDQMLALWRSQFAQLERTLLQAESGAGSPMLFTPMIAAMKATERMGEAALVAQRDTVEAMRPH